VSWSGLVYRRRRDRSQRAQSSDTENTEGSLRRRSAATNGPPAESRTEVDMGELESLSDPSSSLHGSLHSPGGANACAPACLPAEHLLVPRQRGQKCLTL
jgi:hypothetical protein